MSKTYSLWILHIKMHIETYYSRLFTDAEELFVQSFPITSKVANETTAGNSFLMLRRENDPTLTWVMAGGKLSMIP